MEKHLGALETRVRSFPWVSANGLSKLYFRGDSSEKLVTNTKSSALVHSNWTIVDFESRRVTCKVLGGEELTKQDLSQECQQMHLQQVLKIMSWQQTHIRGYLGMNRKGTCCVSKNNELSKAGGKWCCLLSGWHANNWEDFRWTFTKPRGGLKEIAKRWF